MHGQPWTPAEIRRVKAMLSQGKKYNEIANALHRSYDSVKRRIAWLAAKKLERKQEEFRQRKVMAGPPVPEKKPESFIASPAKARLMAGR